MKFLDRLRANPFVQAVVEEFTPDVSTDTAARMLGKVVLYCSLVTLMLALGVRVAWYELSVLIPGTVSHLPWGTTLLLIAIGAMLCLAISIVLAVGRELFESQQAKEPTIAGMFNEALAQWRKRDLQQDDRPPSGRTSGKMQPAAIGQVYCAGVTPGADEQLRIASEKVSEFAKAVFAPLAEQLHGDVIATLTVVETAKLTSCMYVHNFPQVPADERYDALVEDVFAAVDRILHIDDEDGDDISGEQFDLNSDLFSNALNVLKVARKAQRDFYEQTMVPLQV